MRYVAIGLFIGIPSCMIAKQATDFGWLCGWIGGTTAMFLASLTDKPGTEQK